jgi:hypothetical protein
MPNKQAIASDALNANSLAFSLADPIFNDRDRSNMPDQSKTGNSVKAKQKNISDDLDSSLMTGYATKQSDRRFSRGKESRSNTLEVTDALASDTLFDLGASEGMVGTGAIGASGTTSRSALAAPYVDDIMDYGNPYKDSYYWRKQSSQASCAVVAQMSVYQSLTGYSVSEAAASNYAQSQGWFNPATGTPVPDTGKLLNAYGIKTYGGYNLNLRNLAAALKRGDKPIVSLDGSEIWNPKRYPSGTPAEQKDIGHAVWVTGIDVKPNGLTYVILNDSGIGLGKSEVVRSADFYNAWRDYGYFASIADNPYT